MILNAYAIIDLFLTLLRLSLGLLVIFLAYTLWKVSSDRFDPERRTEIENRTYLLLLLGCLLLVLHAVSWPLLYLLLQSYISQWPDVMCIYGVTRVGYGTVGPSRFLPGLIQTLEITKPAIVFLSGVWLVLYLIHRCCRTTEIARRLLLTLFLLGAMGILDALAESAYLVIPKKEEFLSTGCCTVQSLPRLPLFSDQAFPPPSGRPAWISGAFCTLSVGILVSLVWCNRPHGYRPGGKGLAWLLAQSLLTVAAGFLFLTEVATPKLLRQPGHHCAYDLIVEAPQVLPAIFLFLLAAYCVGWSAAAYALARPPEVQPFLDHSVRILLRLALAGYLGSLLLISILMAV